MLLLASTTLSYSSEQGAYAEIDQIAEHQSADYSPDRRSHLATNSKLYASFFDIAEEVSRVIHLADCDTLDIKHIGSLDNTINLSNQITICDDKLYTYKVRGNTIEVMEDEEIVLAIAVAESRFSLNGELYSFDAN